MFKCLQRGIIIRSTSLSISKRPQIMPLRPLLTISSAIVDSLKTEEVFEDVIPEFKPLGLLQVSYGGENEVAMGNTLKVDETQSKPKFQFVLDTPGGSSVDAVEIKDEDLFTLVLTDPDAPSRTDKKWSEYAHYIATDIALKKGADDADFLAAEIDLGAQGKEVLSYQGPGPPKGTGKHRYVFLLYKQASGVSPEAPADRPNWGYGTPATGVLKWSQQYKLEPWAVNFFYAENKEK